MREVVSDVEGRYGKGGESQGRRAWARGKRNVEGERIRKSEVRVRVEEAESASGRFREGEEEGDTV